MLIKAKAVFTTAMLELDNVMTVPSNAVKKGYKDVEITLGNLENIRPLE
jgi:hypothetical protein